ncbi:NADH dehydrogenase ubiquinone 1 alpha subcomplex subunit 11 [Vespula maculifrons]|uniref:NADH dehydrogenase [ubiquinone] 1 alpha subcomplex subunit 11 n=1 Tax=Vespula maculifrons TaxID=7453 RepID=A0ABD2CL92_VESMC
MLIDLKRYNYNHRTEGKEPFQKLIGLGKYAYVGACVTAAYDCSVVRQPHNFRMAFVQGGKHFLVWLGASATFTTAVLCLTNIRKKDDPWNYFFGTLASGGFVYSFLQRGQLVSFVTLYAAIGAAVWKYKLMHGYKPLDRSFKFRISAHYFNFDKTPDVRYEKPN